MAPGVKWTAGLGSALVAVTALVQTTDLVTIRGWATTPERRTFVRASREMFSARNAYYQALRSHEIRALGEGPILVTRAAPDSVRRIVVERATQELAALPQPRVPVRIAVLLGDSAERYGWGMRGLEVYARGGAQPACVAAYRTELPNRYLRSLFLRNSYDWTNVGGPQVRNGLGPCSFWGKYGEPGPRIREWLRAGGYHFADGKAEWLMPADPGRVVTDRMESRMHYLDDHPRARRCRAGDPSNCVRLLTGSTSEDSWRGPILSHTADYARDSSPPFVFGPGDVALLAHVERAFGAQKFEQFWRSGEDLPTAFRNAFGVELGWWLSGWAREHYGEATYGPGMNLLTVLLTLAALGLLVGLAAAVGAQRVIPS